MSDIKDIKTDPVREKLTELLSRYFTIGDSYAYNLTRVKEGFSVGTVTLEDFVEFDDEVVADIVDYLVTHNTSVQEWFPVGERLPEVASKYKRHRSNYTKSIRVLCRCVQRDGKVLVKEGYCEWYNDYPEPLWKIPGTIDSVTHWSYMPTPPESITTESSISNGGMV